jgi:serine O-acetyltransferase
MNRVLFSIALPPSVVVGRDVLFGYSGLGIVVHARAKIGDNVKISQNVTIGGRSGHIEVPVIEDDVEIGAGACILGPIRIGRGAKIGANAVVLHDVPAHAIAVGVPAQVRTL